MRAELYATTGPFASGRPIRFNVSETAVALPRVAGRRSGREARASPRPPCGRPSHGWALLGSTPIGTSDVFVHFGAFVAISVLLSITPGPDTALVTRNALVGGRRAGFFTVLGIGLGLLVWTVAASVGIAAILRASEPAFVAVKVVGSVYLVFLGAQALWAAIRGTRRGSSRRAAARKLAPRVAFRQGLVTNLGNPKIAIFFTSFLPQFAAGDDPTFLALLVGSRSRSARSG